MGSGLRLELRQSQQLVMTPQLQQAIKLLQMSTVELTAFVAEEVERNPLLATEAGEEEMRAGPAAPERAERTDDRVTESGDLSLVSETFDTGTDNLFDTGPGEAPGPQAGDGLGLRARSGQGLETEEGFETRLTRPETLREHLLAQIGLMRAEAETAALATLLVEELDEAGYLRTPLPEIAERLGAPLPAVESALALLQRCEPTGVGARDVAECFALQLAERNRLDPAIEALLAHLDLLATGQVDQLRKKCRIEAEDLADMLADLRRLDPRPGAGFAAEDPETVVADVLLRPTNWGGWHVELNADALPKVLIDQRYAAQLARGGAKTREFVNTCRDQASWLLKSLDQRARTILKVSTEIVRQQEAFFTQGPSGLRPMSLKMVADEIGMHESTVSRVTSNKYMATERGIFELKYFFTNSVSGGGDGGALSAEAVRTRLKALVAGERADSVLSDDRIVEILQGEGIEIARRTVAKYRNSLGIPSSSARRRAYALRELT